MLIIWLFRAAGTQIQDLDDYFYRRFYHGENNRMSPVCIGVQDMYPERRLLYSVGVL